VLLLLGDENGPAYVEVGGQGHVDGVGIWIVKDGLVRHRSFGRIGWISASAQREETSAYSEERHRRQTSSSPVGERFFGGRERGVREREKRRKKKKKKKKTTTIKKIVDM
jgi:hypothetical protein